jgi:hypothetical protein
MQRHLPGIKGKDFLATCVVAPSDYDAWESVALLMRSKLGLKQRNELAKILKGRKLLLPVGHLRTPSRWCGTRPDSNWPLQRIRPAFGQLQPSIRSKLVILRLSVRQIQPLWIIHREPLSRRRPSHRLRDCLQRTPSKRFGTTQPRLKVLAANNTIK